jgi:hypothetical protein
MILREPVQVIDNGTLVEAETPVKRLSARQPGGGVTSGNAEHATVRDELRRLNFSVPDAQIHINGVAAGAGNAGMAVRLFHVSPIDRIHSIIYRSFGKEQPARRLRRVFAFFHVFYLIDEKALLMAATSVAAGWSAAALLTAAAGVAAPPGHPSMTACLDAAGQQAHRLSASADAARSGIAGLRHVLDNLGNRSASGASVFIYRHKWCPSPVQRIKTAAAITVVYP